ncbi:helix-turn-helix transcriptional regulator [Methylobacterium ajmalii]|uniref:helix-turn-helix transcriptional regulator n=1 Tax=Methylobacterium ajmalii TaxID=2738439 RepID=UPI002F358915
MTTATDSKSISTQVSAHAETEARSKEQLRTEIMEWIDHILKQKDWNGSELSRAAGLSASTVLRFMNNPDHRHLPTFATLKKLSEGSGYPIPRALMEAHEISRIERGPEPEPKARPAADRAVLERRAAGAMRPAFASEARAAAPAIRQIPLMRMSSLPSSLMPLYGSATQTTDCPPQLAADPTAFAFRLPDDSLAPVAPQGSMAYAVRSLDPVRGNKVVIVAQDGRPHIGVIKEVDSAGIHLHRGCREEDGMSFGMDEIKDWGVIVSIDLR